MEDPLLGKPARNRPVTHISLNLLSGMLLSMRVVPDGRDGNVVFGRTLRWGEADDGRGVTVARGEEFTIPKGRLVVQLDHIDSLSELGPGGYAPVANTIWTWYQVGPHPDAGVYRALLSLARRVDTAHELWAIAVKQRKEALDTWLGVTLPPDIVALLLRAHPDFEAVASFAADISPDGRLTTDWLAAGPAGVALIRDGSVTLLAGGEIDSLATHRYLSGGRLVAQRNGSVRLLARYSGARLASAEEFAQAANRVLRSGATGALEREAAPAAEPVAEPMQEEAPAAGGRVLPRLFAMMPASKYWRVPVIAVALAAGAAVMTPLLAGRFLFDEVLAPDGRFAGRLLLAVGLILLTLLAEVGAKVTWGWTNAAFIHDLEVTLKRSAVGSLQRLSMRFYSARHTGEMMTRLEQDASDIALLFHIIAPSALTGGLFLAGSLVAMLALDWQLAAAAILPFPLLFIVLTRIDIVVVSARYGRHPQ